MRTRIIHQKGIYLSPKEIRKLTNCRRGIWNRALQLSGVKLIGNFPLTDEQAFRVIQRIRQLQGEDYLKSLTRQS